MEFNSRKRLKCQAETEKQNKSQFSGITFQEIFKTI